MKLKLFFAGLMALGSFVYANGPVTNRVGYLIFDDSLDRETEYASEIKPMEVLLLIALPGSGKSEVRKYLSNLTPQERLEQFGIGEMVQLDDFPYVHMMRRISAELQKRGHDGFFFLSSELPFRDPYEWGTLMHLINNDYEDLISKNRQNPDCCAEWVFNRIDAARQKAGNTPLLSDLDPELREQIARAVEKDAKKLLDNLVSEMQDVEGKTIVIEFARGGAHGAKMPLPSPYGYQYALSLLKPEILEKASIVYVWVTPEESRRKNEVRADPNDPGSILHHGVPLAVMYNDYGCDDISYLLSVSDRSETVKIHAQGKDYFLPLGRFDNRIDKTSFVRNDASLWGIEDVAKLKKALREAFTQLQEGSDTSY